MGRRATRRESKKTTANVAEDIRLTGAKAVDVSSGVETAPGIKDAALIRRFVANAKAA